MAFPALAALLPLLAKLGAGATAAGGGAAAAGGAAAGGAAAGGAGAGGMAGGMSLASLAPNAGQGMLSQGMSLNPASQGQQEPPKQAAAKKPWEEPPIPYEAPQIQPLRTSPSPGYDDGQAPGWGFLRAYLGK